tara:strand:- start:30 stop:242 length:213 start_codon:yes stop_codon:yes gene_type:complete
VVFIFRVFWVFWVLRCGALCTSLRLNRNYYAKGEIAFSSLKRPFFIKKICCEITNCVKIIYFLENLSIFR